MATFDAVGYRFAGFWWRFLAFLIDHFILMIAGAIVGALLGFLLGAEGMDVVGIKVTVSLLAVIWTWLYFSLFESSTLQATLGKRACGLIVTNDAGERISFGRATGRHFAKWISALILGIGFLMAGWTRRKQALHDMICDCLVLKRLEEAARVMLPG